MWTKVFRLPRHFGQQLPTLWEQFLGKALFCSSMTLPQWFILVHKGLFGVEELDWPAQSPDLNPIKHLPNSVSAKAN